MRRCTAPIANFCSNNTALGHNINIDTLIIRDGELFKVTTPYYLDWQVAKFYSRPGVVPGVPQPECRGTIDADSFG